MEKNEFHKICGELGKKVMYSEDNPIDSAKEYLREYMDNDINRLLRIKAEASEIQYPMFVTMLFSLTAFAVSTFSFMRSIYQDSRFDFVIWILLLVILCILIHKLWLCKNEGKWQRYILVSIEEIELEYREAKKTEQKK